MTFPLQDILNFASKSTPRKMLNAGRVLSSFYYSRVINKPYHLGLPISISIEPTTSCNLRCPECPSGLRSFTRPTGMLSEALYQSVIDQLVPHLSYLNFYFQGEPFLNTRFLDMVHYASSRKVYTATSTNAHYLSEDKARQTVESGLDRLIISVDGTTQDTYEQYRVGGNLSKVMEGTQNIIHWKKKLKSSSPHLVFQFLVVRPNEHQVDEVKQLAKQIGVDEVSFKTAQIYNYQNGSDLIPLDPKYSRYRKDASGRFSIKNGLLNHCWKMWHSCVITWDGKVVPCCFDKDAHFVLGDLNQETFTEIWNGKPYETFRASLLKSRSEIEICKNCSEGTRVWA